MQSRIKRRRKGTKPLLFLLLLPSASLFAHADSILHSLLSMGDVDGLTALHLAAQERRNQCAELLQQHAPQSIYLKDANGWTPDVHAVYTGRQGIKKGERGAREENSCLYLCSQATSRLLRNCRHHPILLPLKFNPTPFKSKSKL